MRLITTLVLAALALSITVPAQAQDKAAAVFDSLYGAKVRAAKKSTNKTDDVELAVELLEGAKISLDQKNLLILLCDNAYDMGSRSTQGYEHAIEAMRLLAEHVPAKKAEAKRKILKLLEKQYRSAKTKDLRLAAGQIYLVGLLETADALLADQDATSAIAQYAKARIVASRIKSDRLDRIKQKQVAATALRTTFQTLKLLMVKLEANAKDEASAKRLIEIYLGQLDDPQEARQYTVLITDDALKTKLALTAKPIDELEEEQLLTMGKWYHGFAMKAGQHVKASLLSRTKAYYEQYLELHQDEDIPRTSAQLKINKINAQLANLPGASKVTREDDIKWVDMTETFMQIVTDKSYIQRGAKVEFKEKVLQLRGDGRGGAYLVAPIDVESFVFNVKINRLSGSSVMIGGRTTSDGHYQVTMLPSGVITMNRWVEQGSVAVELARGTVNEILGQKAITLNFAVIDDIIILFVNGKRVLAAKDDVVFGRGGLILGGTGADVDFSDLKYMVPTEEQIKQMTAPAKK